MMLKAEGEGGQDVGRENRSDSKGLNEIRNKNVTFNHSTAMPDAFFRKRSCLWSSEKMMSG